MSGNTLGERRSYRYTSDTGTAYCIVTDLDLGTAAGLTLSTEHPSLPRRFRPRVVFVEAIVGTKKVRKALVVNTNSDLFSDTAESVLIDGVTFTSTGRRGEKYSWVTNPPVAP